MESPCRGQSKRVLVVDDEPMMTRVLVGALEWEEDGYVVETAGDGHEALSKMRQARYSLLVTDYDMPGMTGVELAQAARPISPDTRLVLMTGNDAAALCAQIRHLNPVACLQKPFDLVEFIEVVQRAVS